jgi:drug/metabolite transporter, DME family
MFVRVTSPCRGGVGGVLAAAALWGTVGPAQVLAAARVDPVALGAARLLAGGGLLLVAAPLLASRSRPAGSRWWLRGSTVGWLVLAAAATAAYQAGFLSSVQRTGAALATVVALGVAPPAVGLVARVVMAERLTGRWLAGTAVTVAGTALLVLPGARAGVDVAGVALGVLGGLCYGLYTVAGKRLLDGPAPTVPAVALTLVLGGLMLLPLAHHPGAVLAAPRALALTGWLAGPATALAYLLFVTGLRHVSAATAGTLSLAEPLVAAVLGIAVLGERLSPAGTAGALLLVLGLVAVSVPARNDHIGAAGPSGSRTVRRPGRAREGTRCSVRS